MPSLAFLARLARLGLVMLAMSAAVVLAATVPEPGDAEPSVAVWAAGAANSDPASVVLALVAVTAAGIARRRGR